MTSVFCGQRLFGRVTAEPGPAPNHTSLQPRSDSHRGWGGEGGRQRFLSLGSDQTRAPGLPGDVTRPSSLLLLSPPSSPCCQSCVKCFTLSHDAHVCVLACMRLCSAEAAKRCTEARVEETKRHARIQRASQEVLSQKRPNVQAKRGLE